MYALTELAIKSLRMSPRRRIVLQVYKNKVRREDIEKKLRLSGGGVAFKGGTGPRASLSLSLVDRQGLFNDLKPAGLEIWPFYDIVFIDRKFEQIPLGKLVVNSESVSYSSDSSEISLTGEDYWEYIKGARFMKPVVKTGPVTAVVRDFVVEAIPGVQVVVTQPNTTRVTGAVFKRDRDTAIKDLLDSIGYEGFFNRDGVFVMRPVPSLTGTTAFAFREGETGTIVTASRDRQRSDVRNAWVANPAGKYAWETIAVEDRSAKSETNVATFGRVPGFFASPLVSTRGQALNAIRARLRRTTGMVASASLTVLTNPAFDPGDVVGTSLGTQPGKTPVSERYILDSTTVSFTDGVQPVTMRSALPEAVGDQEEGVVIT